MTQDGNTSAVFGKWSIREQTLDYGKRMLVMGILNVTPDSFSDGGSFYTPEHARIGALGLQEDGADILDIGAESTRPGSERISADEELSRLIPALQLILKEVKIPVSIDTYKSKTAREALRFGASIINDVWGLQYDPEMADVVSQYGAGVVIMANYTDAKIFERKGDIVSDCLRFFEKSAEIAQKAGIKANNMIFDPGIGFGTDTQESLTLIRSIPRIQNEGYPLLIGPSRKRFIGETLGGVPADRRDAATAAVSLFCRENKAACVRIHNVYETVTAVKMMEALQGGENG
ncbi:MAG: dihydropteroate synthase [Clostridiales bacterium]|nr:dihydropteroate synthase [Clostridiales bacterium]